MKNSNARQIFRINLNINDVNVSWLSYNNNADS